MTEVEELLLDWLDPCLTGEEQDRLTGWHRADEPVFELALGGKDGARFEIDGVERRVEPHMVNVRIGRLMSFSSICGPTEGGVSRYVRREEDWKTK